MIRRMLALAALSLTAACGIDGPPHAPGPGTAGPDDTPPPGVRITGEARIGMTGAL